MKSNKMLRRTGWVGLATLALLVQGACGGVESSGPRGSGGAAGHSGSGGKDGGAGSKTGSGGSGGVFEAGSDGNSSSGGAAGDDASAGSGGQGGSGGDTVDSDTEGGAGGSGGAEASGGSGGAPDDNLDANTGGASDDAGDDARDSAGSDETDASAGGGGNDASTDGGGTAGGDGGVTDAGTDVATDAPTDGAGGASDLCAANYDRNAYTFANAGCGGYTSCRGQLHILNPTSTTWTAPVIKFTVASGVTCTKTHSSPKWIITDDGSSSHQCVFTGKYPDSNGNLWSVAANGGVWGFGYDTTATTSDPPTNVSVSAAACIAAGE